MGKLTDVRIRNWLKVGRPLARADSGGLTFTLSANRTAAWVLRYRFGGKPRELTIGRYPDITLAKARELATEARAKIQQGIDVAREKQKTSIARVAAKSFRQLATSYMERAFPDLAPTTAKQRRHHIEDIIIPKLGGLAARDVTTADIVALIASVGQRSTSVAALLFTTLSEIFKHGVARHAVTANPCSGISVSAICGKAEPKRLRLKLTADELRVILPELHSIGEQNALAVKLLLATCVRIGELARAEWVHIDMDHAEWFVPPYNSKSRKGFTVPLTPAVVTWFNQLQTLSCGLPFVLPARQKRRNRRLGETHFEQRTLNSALSKLCDRLSEKVRRFTPHDLRSTARSHLAAFGGAPYRRGAMFESLVGRPDRRL